MFVNINTDNQVKTDAEANDRLEQKVRAKLKRFERRLSDVEVHVGDMNASKGGGADKKVSLEARLNGHPPVAVHADAPTVDAALGLAADKAVRALEHALGKEKAH